MEIAVDWEEIAEAIEATAVVAIGLEVTEVM
jgi:hypothetical protein